MALTYQQWQNAIARMRAQGVEVIEMPGWYANGHGPMGEINGAMIHHTADLGQGRDYAHWIGYVGRSDLAAPLCNVCIPRDGKVYLVAGQKAYHAGLGTVAAYNAIRAGLTRSTPEMRPADRGSVDLNPHLYGWEVCGTGASPDFTDKQYRAATISIAEVLRELGYGPDVIAHKEATTAKPGDPNIPMQRFRSDVADVLGGSTPSVTPSLPSSGGATIDPLEVIMSRESLINEIEYLPKNFQAVNVKLDTLTGIVARQGEQIAALVKTVAAIKEETDWLPANFAADAARVDALASRVGAQAAQVAGELGLTEEQAAALADRLAERIGKQRIEISVKEA